MTRLTIIAILLSLKCQAQNPDAIVGKWLKENKEDLVIDVYKEQGEYRGKIAWSKDSSKPKGFVLLDNLQYNEQSNQWENGKIYRPGSNRSYDAIVKMNADGTLLLTAKMLLVRGKRTFKRVK